MVVAGMLNKQIAAELGTAESAVKVQRSRAMEKMQEASLAELIKMIEKVKASAEKPRKPKLTNILLFANPEIPTLNRFLSPIGITSFQLELKVLKNLISAVDDDACILLTTTLLIESFGLARPRLLLIRFCPITRPGTKDGTATLQARPRHREVTDEGDCGD